MRLRMRAVVAVVLALAAIAGAQANRGQLTGIVTDTAGGMLPGVAVTLSGVERRTTVTNERGEFTFTNLLPGRYELRLTLAGFVDLARDVTVTADDTVHLTLQLAVGSLAETVTVSSAEAPAGLQQSARVARGVAGGIVGGVADSASPAPQSARSFEAARALPRAPFNTEAYDHVQENGLRRVANDPLSTFSVDVDTASYANVRRFLTAGTPPPAGAVRVEELTGKRIGAVTGTWGGP